MANESQVSSAVRESITGDRIGLTVMADAITATRDILTGDRYGLTVKADALTATRDILTGDGYGNTWFDGVAMVVREALIAEPPFRAAHAMREVLMTGQPDEPLTQARIVPNYRQAVMMARPTMALPSTVKSAQIVPTFRQQTVQHVVRSWARSTDFTGTLCMQALSRRNVLPAPQMHGLTPVGIFREQVVQSRGKTYIAVSAVYTASQRQLVVSHRVVTAPSQIRTTIKVGTEAQQIVMSRRVMLVMTDADVYTLGQQIAQKATRAVPRSEIDSGKLLHMTVQRHTVIPPGIDDRAGTLGQQVMMARVPTTPRADDIAATLGQQVVSHRVVTPQRSEIDAGGSVMLTLLHRDTYAPQFIMGRHTATLGQQIVQHRPATVTHSLTSVSSLSLSFALRRIVPAPIDVIDPSIGRHAFSMSMLTVQHRVTVPPEVISTQSRFVYSALGQVVIQDVFPAPDYPPPVHETDVNSVIEQVAHADLGEWAAVSRVTVDSVLAAVALGDADGWLDATVPQSAVLAHGVIESLAVGDAFPDSMAIRSDAVVAALGTAVVLGDSTMPDPLQPLSEIAVEQVIELAAVGDVQFPDPLIPSSEVRSRSLAAITVLGDANLTGRFDMSEIRCPTLAEFVVVPDRSLVGIPLRKGPRPVISVSMT